MTADAILKGLVEIRVARRAKFVPYDEDRRMKRREKELWAMAEQLAAEPVKPRGKPEKSAA